MRADGSSKFAKGNKWGYFPSVSGAWRISQEKFFEESNAVNVVNNLKLRAGYGVTGNNGIGDNLYTTAVTLGSYPMDNNEQNPSFGTVLCSCRCARCTADGRVARTTGRPAL